MRRIVLMVLKLFVYIPYWFYKICQYGNTEKYDEATRYNFLRRITIKANKAGRVRVVSTGIENLPKKSGYIMFPNHQGLFDALAFLQTHEAPFSVVMKKETQNIILLKQIIKLLQAQVIDREDVRQSMRVIMNMTKEVKEGRNYIIFAEGTRSKLENNILEFKGGSFKSAMNARCPIVPVALVDSFKVFDTNSTSKVRVQIHYLKPIPYEEYAGMKSHEIAKMVEERITQAIQKYSQ